MISENWKLETKDVLLALKFLSSIWKQRNDKRPLLLTDAIAPLFFVTAEVTIALTIALPAPVQLLSYVQSVLKWCEVLSIFEKCPKLNRTKSEMIWLGSMHYRKDIRLINLKMSRNQSTRLEYIYMWSISAWNKALKLNRVKRLRSNSDAPW